MVGRPALDAGGACRAHQPRRTTMDSARYHKVQIGNHALQPETLMLGYGYDPALSEGSAKPPVFLTSTFVFRTAEEGRDFFDYTAGRREPPAGRTIRARLFPLQPPQPRNRRGPARRLRERRAGPRVLLRHGGDLDHHPDPCPAGRRHPAQPPALRRHRSADREDADAVRHRGRGVHRRSRREPRTRPQRNAPWPRAASP